MTRSRHVLLAFTLASCHREAAVPTAPMLPPTPTEVAAQPHPQARQAELVRGEYVAKIAGCTTCHAADLAGGAEMPVGGGVARMPNITPDPQTGVGGWSDSQLVAAIRIGVRPDGAHLAPLMPYTFYNRMTDADASALVAYLRARPPVRKQVARSEHLPMKPITIAAPRANVDRVEDPHAHGEYVAALMHCGACHTPQQGPFVNQAFAGGTVFSGPQGPVIAANLTSDRDTGVGTFDEQDLTRAVRQMKDPTGQDLRAPMAMYAEAWSHLSDADAHALAVFLKAIPPVHHDVTAEVPPTVTRQP